MRVEGEIMLTYEQLRPSLEAWGDYYSKRSDLESDELINEVWSRNRVQALDNIKYASRKIRWEMLDILRYRNGKRSNLLKTEKIPENIPKEGFLENLMKKDLVDVIFRKSGVYGRNREMVWLHLGEGFTAGEIGERFGLTKSGVSWQIRRALEKIREYARCA